VGYAVAGFKRKFEHGLYEKLQAGAINVGGAISLSWRD
jgi:hypothetical protein